MEIVQQITSSVWGIAAAIAVLGLCVFFHETGHFIAAKLAGMRVDDFAIGFGPPLVSFRRGETLYALRWVPLGGFVRIAGMDPEEDRVERGFYSKPRWVGAAVILAGVSMNIVLAFLLFTLVVYTQGISVPGAPGTEVQRLLPRTPAATSDLQPGDLIVAVDGNEQGLMIAEVAPESPATQAGLEAGDRILQVEQKLVAVPADLVAALQGAPSQTRWVAVFKATAADPTEAVAIVEMPTLPSGPQTDPRRAESLLADRLGLSFGPLHQLDVVAYTSARPGETLTLTVDRNGARVDIAIVPQAETARIMRVTERGKLATPHETVGRIGLLLGAPREPVGLVRSLRLGVEQTAGSVVAVVFALRAIVSGRIAATPGGPVAIVAMTSEQAQLGWSSAAAFGGFISANLAVFNLLPIPPLDGFVILVLLFEGILRRRVDARVQRVAQWAGIFMLLALFVGLTFNDLFNLIVHGTP